MSAEPRVLGSRPDGGTRDEAGDASLTLRVRQVTWEAEDIISFALVDTARRDLPIWTPGAHIDLHLAPGLIRQYSLCGDPDDRSTYQIAVLRDPASRGGSRYLHENAVIGRHYEARSPRNNFTLVPAPSYLFITGGIGITPILPMCRTVERSRARWHLLYGGRRRAGMAFLDDILQGRSGSVEIVPEDECGRLDISRALSEISPDTVIYCCGPDGLLKAVEAEAESRGLLSRLHVERFEPSIRPPGAENSVDSPFQVTLARTGVTMTVPPDRSVLDVVREATPAVAYSCEEGYCGSCRVAVLEGCPEHRDDVLTSEERSRGGEMLICVSRARSPRLVLDL
jgi:ferredoxin-NADP reductase